MNRVGLFNAISLARIVVYVVARLLDDPDERESYPVDADERRQWGLRVPFSYGAQPVESWHWERLAMGQGEWA